jgi:hypothetical protein
MIFLTVSPPCAFADDIRPTRAMMSALCIDGVPQITGKKKSYQARAYCNWKNAACSVSSGVCAMVI